MDGLDLDQLARSPVFGGLIGDDLTAVAERLGSRCHAAGTWLVREGEPAREMYVIRTGSVEVVRMLPDDAGEEIVCVLGVGDCFGEMALIDIQPRSASVRAGVEADVLTLSNQDLLALATKRPATYALVVGNIAREISRRLRRRDAVAAEFLAERRRGDETA